MGSPYENEEKAVRDAVLNLFGVSGADNFIIPSPGTAPPLYIAVGEAERICEAAAEQSALGLTPAALKPRLIQDALRYRWLKSHASKIEWRESDVNGPLKLRPTLDADVDDAIAHLRPTKGGDHGQ
jgi:alkanesulfonate monooxygenase SsuD/methylene tetrahydromethanopterin reductase-like flavin-dependent oxidoreductase (luciferase family)